MGADETGFETRHEFFHYTSMCNLMRTFIKMSAISNTVTHLVGAIVIGYHSVGYDIVYLPEIFERISELTDIRTIVLDKGYDAKYVHELIRGKGVMSVILVRGDDVSI